MSESVNDVELYYFSFKLLLSFRRMNNDSQLLLLYVSDRISSIAVTIDLKIMMNDDWVDSSTGVYPNEVDEKEIWGYKLV